MVEGQSGDGRLHFSLMVSCQGKTGRMKQMHFVSNFLCYDLRANTVPPFARREFIAKGICVKSVSGQMWSHEADAFGMELLRYNLRADCFEVCSEGVDCRRDLCQICVKEKVGT